MNENEIKMIIEEEPQDILSVLNDDNAITDDTNDVMGYDDTQPWYKSWAVWLSIAGLISILFSATGLFEKMGMTSDTFNTIIEAIGTILTAFGIINNPTVKGRLS